MLMARVPKLAKSHEQRVREKSDVAKKIGYFFTAHRCEHRNFES